MARIDRSLLVFLGVLIAHEVAYLTSSVLGYENSVTHGHLKTAWLLGSVALLGVLARSVLRSLRRRHHTPGNPATLSALIAGGYVVVEQAERLVDGYSALTLFSEPVFWLGIAAAPLVAGVLVRSLESVAAATARLVGEALADPEPISPTCTLRSTSLRLRTTIFLSSGVSRRGPPVSLSI